LQYLRRVPCVVSHHCVRVRLSLPHQRCSSIPQDDSGLIKSLRALSFVAATHKELGIATIAVFASVISLVSYCLTLLSRISKQEVTIQALNQRVEDAQQLAVCACVLCAAYCVLCAVYCVLCAVCCVLCAVCCVLCAVCCVLCAVCCMLYIMCCDV
jgi:hypothetical protein